MPPRYAYWTIIVDDQPTAFRSGSQEELMPTFKRLKAKNDTAVMMWFQNGKLWPSRLDAQEMMRARGEMGRRGDDRQAGSGFRDRNSKTSRSAWTPRGEPSTPPPARNSDDKLDWKPKGEFTPAPKRADRPDWKPKSEWSSRTSRPQDLKASRPEKPEWKPKGEWSSEAEGRGPRHSAKREGGPDWKPKGSFTPAPRRPATSDWKPKGEWSSRTSRPQNLKASRPEWKPKGSFTPAPRRPASSDWKPKGEWSSRSSRPSAYAKPPADRQDLKTSRPQDLKTSGPPEKRKWVPKEEYKKSMGIEARRDSKWRPGGEHKDPKQKYKDAKKAKWSKFKQNIRARSGGKGKKSS